MPDLCTAIITKRITAAAPKRSTVRCAQCGSRMIAERRVALMLRSVPRQRRRRRGTPDRGMTPHFRPAWLSSPERYFLDFLTGIGWRGSDFAHS
jgi:DNA-directed RNA polymerase subunit RPC12/RpoP